jgi:hypothetical protein
MDGKMEDNSIYINHDKYTDIQRDKIDKLREEYAKIKVIKRGDCSFSMIDCRDIRFDSEDSYLVFIHIGHRLFPFRGNIDNIIEHLEEFLESLRLQYYERH